MAAAAVATWGAELSASMDLQRWHLLATELDRKVLIASDSHAYRQKRAEQRFSTVAGSEADARTPDPLERK